MIEFIMQWVIPVTVTGIMGVVVYFQYLEQEEKYTKKKESKNIIS